MLAFQHVLPNPGDLVRIIPIQENGTVKICRRDDQGEMIIEVILSDGEVHLCRECEIKPEVIPGSVVVGGI